VTLVGIALIILGVLALAYQGITYTTREKVIDLGPLKASVDKEKNIPLPPIVGVLALAGGVVLVIVGRVTRRRGRPAVTRDHKLCRAISSCNDERGADMSLTTGVEHSPTSATGSGWERTPWHATQRAGWEALRKG